jgi:hypothetical protein
MREANRMRLEQEVWDAYFIHALQEGTSTSLFIPFFSFLCYCQSFQRDYHAILAYNRFGSLDDPTHYSR